MKNHSRIFCTIEYSTFYLFQKSALISIMGLPASSSITILPFKDVTFSRYKFHWDTHHEHEHGRFFSILFAFRHRYRFLFRINSGNIKYEKRPGSSCWLMIVAEREELQRGREHKHFRGLSEMGNGDFIKWYSFFSHRHFDFRNKCWMFLHLYEHNM